MILSTTHTVAGKEISETLGLVRGSTVRARHVGRDILAGLLKWSLTCLVPECRLMIF